MQVAILRQREEAAAADRPRAGPPVVQFVVNPHGAAAPAARPRPGIWAQLRQRLRDPGNIHVQALVQLVVVLAILYQVWGAGIGSCRRVGVLYT